MTQRAEYNINIKRALDIVSIDQNMNDDDLVYLDNRSLKVVTPEVSQGESQALLEELLLEKLDEPGRQSLGKRLIEKQPITYKEIKLLVHHINKQQTKPQEKEATNQETIERSYNNPIMRRSSDILDSGQDSSIDDKDTESFPSMSDETKGNDPSPRLSTVSLQVKPERDDQASLASSQGARPKKVVVRPESYLDLIKSRHINNQNDLSDFTMECCHVVLNDMEKRKNDVLNYLADPTNEIKFNIAKSSFNHGIWFRNPYFDLLIDATAVSKHSFFKKRLKEFIGKTYYCNGCPPMNSATKKFYMNSKYTSHKSDNYIHYILAANVTPSDALRGCSYELWFSDQGTFTKHIFYIVLYKILTEQQFNYYFINDWEHSERFSLSSFNFSDIENGKDLSRINKFLTWSEEIKFEKACVYIFANDENYRYKDAFGDFNFMCTFCDKCDDQMRFCSPGLHNNAGLYCCREKIISEYNKEPYINRIRCVADEMEISGIVKNNSTGKCLVLGSSIIVNGVVIHQRENWFVHQIITANIDRVIKLKKALEKDVKLSQHEESLNLKELLRQQAIQKQKDKKSTNKSRFSEPVETLKPTSPSTCSSKITPIIEQSKCDIEPDPIYVLQEKINECNREIRLHDRGKSKKNSKEIIELSNSLKSFCARIIGEGFTISAEDQCHYDKVIERINRMRE